MVDQGFSHNHPGTIWIYEAVMLKSSTVTFYFCLCLPESLSAWQLTDNSNPLYVKHALFWYPGKDGGWVNIEYQIKCFWFICWVFICDSQLQNYRGDPERERFLKFNWAPKWQPQVMVASKMLLRKKLCENLRFY